MSFIFNTAISALLIALVAEVSKRSTFLGALLISLPITSILALSFLYWNTKDAEQVARLSLGIFWLVLPTLLFFLLLPVLLKAGWNFWIAMPVAAIALIFCFAGYSWVLARAGIKI